jgi:hypothetical protein
LAVESRTILTKCVSVLILPLRLCLTSPVEQRCLHCFLFCTLVGAKALFSEVCQSSSLTQRMRRQDNRVKRGRRSNLPRVPRLCPQSRCEAFRWWRKRMTDPKEQLRCQCLSTLLAGATPPSLLYFDAHQIVVVTLAA